LANSGKPAFLNITPAIILKAVPAIKLVDAAMTRIIAGVF
jgi:hypothetical protein